MKIVCHIQYARSLPNFSGIKDVPILLDGHVSTRLAIYAALSLPSHIGDRREVYMYVVCYKRLQT